VMAFQWRQRGRLCNGLLLALLLETIAVVGALADPPSLTATLVTLDHQNFPFIYLNVRLDVNSSTAAPQLPSFAVSENGVPQTDYFQVTPPEASGGVRLVDIVFIMDNSGSMEEEQDAVRERVLDFVDDLAASAVDYALGLCRFGANEKEGHPILEDAGVLTSDPRYFQTKVWGRNRVAGGYEPGWDALYEAANGFSYRPGAQKVLILITDETVTNDSRANAGARSQEEVISLLRAKSITVFSLVNLSAPYEEPNHALSDYGTISEQTNGACFDIFSPFGEILSFVSTEAARTYLVAYRSSKPVLDGQERRVTATASYLAAQAECEGRYVPGAAPKVQRTGETVALHEHAWAAGTTLAISAEITDTTEPFVESATLHYRQTGEASYATTSMVYASGIWTGTIPGASVKAPGCDYYISATDSQSTATTPTVDPRAHPHQVAVLPNVAPEITHTPVTSAIEDVDIGVSARITDTTNQVARARLRYRSVGELIYRDSGEMANTGRSTYIATIPGGFVSTAGVEYYIEAVDDLGVNRTNGAPDSPHVIRVAHTPVILIHGIMGAEIVGPILQVGGSVLEWKIWPAAAVRAADPYSLMLTPEGLDPVGSQLHVGDILSYVLDPQVGVLPHVFPVYGKLIDHLVDRGYVKDTDLFAFAYDWRKNLTETARDLGTRIQEVVAETGGRKVNIVAHSMGGVVARQYLNTTPNAPVQKLILLGVPSHGSPDAFQALHPELGLPIGLQPGNVMQEIASTCPATFELLPTARFFELYDHIFEDYRGYAAGSSKWTTPGPIIGETGEATWTATYVTNPNSSLQGVNHALLMQALSFHDTLGSSLGFAGQTFIIAGSGRATNLVFVRRQAHPITAAGLTMHEDFTWTARPTNGDGRVPLLSVTQLESDGPVSVFHTKADHTGMLNNGDVQTLLASILSGTPIAEGDVAKEDSLSDGCRENQANPRYRTAVVTIKSPVELHIYDEAGEHIGPTAEGYIEKTADADYFYLGENTVAYLPVDGKYSLELVGLSAGVFGIDFTVYDEISGEDANAYSLDDLPTAEGARAWVGYEPNASAAPVLHLDLDGDGTIDSTYTATPQAAWLESSTEAVTPAAGVRLTGDEISINTVPELRSWLTLRSGGAGGASLWVSPIAVTLGREALAVLQEMDSASQLLVVGLLASLEADGQLERLIAAFPGDVGEFVDGLADDPLGLMARAGIPLSLAPRTAMTDSIARDPGMLFWYEERMGALLTGASEELHILLPRYPQFQIPAAVGGFTGFVFILDEIGATPAKTAADAFLYFSTIDEARVAPTALTLGKANVGAGGALLPVQNRFEWSYGRRMWIEPAD